MNNQLPEPSDARSRASADPLLPPPASGAARASHVDPPTPRRPVDPNFAARRMLVVTILITAIAAGGLSLWRLTGHSDSHLTAPTTPANWNRIVLIDNRNGDLATVTASGKPDGSQSASASVKSVTAAGNTVAIITDTNVTMTDVDRPATIFALSPGSEVSSLPIPSRVVLTAGTAAGGNLTIMRAGDSEAIDLGALTGQTAPRFFADSIRTDTNGERFAVADAKNFQTVVVTDPKTPPMYLAGIPLALDDDIIATSQVVGTSADITLSSNDRKTLATATIDLPIGGAIIDGALIVVTNKGDVVQVTTKSSEPAKTLGSVAIPADATDLSVVPAANGKALVILSDRFEAVVGVDGSSIFSTTFTTPVTPSAPLVTPLTTWTCLPVGGADQPHSLVNLTDGTQLADLSGTKIDAVSADGCTVLVSRAGTHELVNAQGVVPIGPARYLALAPDGRGVVRQTDSARVEFVPIKDDNTLGDPVDLTNLAPTNLTVTFLNR